MVMAFKVGENVNLYSSSHENTEEKMAFTIQQLTHITIIFQSLGQQGLCLL
jgi:hypothetical protein